MGPSKNAGMGVNDQQPMNPMQAEMREHAEHLAELALLAQLASILKRLQDRYDLPHALEATVAVNMRITQRPWMTGQACVMSASMRMQTAHAAHTEAPVLELPVESRVSWYPEGSHGITCEVRGGDGISR